jgi:hypothetical protein
MSSTTVITSRRPDAPAAVRSGRRLLDGPPGGLLLVRVLAVTVVVLPVGVTIAQAFDDGISAAVRAIDASSATLVAFGARRPNSYAPS